MSNTELAIKNCCSSEGIDGWVETINSWGLTDEKLAARLQKALDRRRYELANGINAEPPDAKPQQMLFTPKQKLQLRWKPITKWDGDGSLLLVGWERSASSRKRNKRDGTEDIRMLKKPQVLQAAKQKEAAK